MNEQLESILNKAPNLYDGEHYNLRNGTQKMAQQVTLLEFQILT